MTNRHQTVMKDFVDLRGRLKVIEIVGRNVHLINKKLTDKIDALRKGSSNKFLIN